MEKNASIEFNEKQLEINYLELPGSTMILIRDVSVINQMLKAKAEAKHASFLTNTITHELRTPTNSIKYMIKEASYHALPEDRELLSIAESNCEFLLTLINDILDYAKIEAGTFKLTLVNFSPLSIIKKCIQLFEFPVKSKKIFLKLDVSDPIPK